MLLPYALLEKDVPDVKYFIDHSLNTVTICDPFANGSNVYATSVINNKCTQFFGPVKLDADAKDISHLSLSPDQSLLLFAHTAPNSEASITISSLSSITTLYSIPVITKLAHSATILSINWVDSITFLVITTLGFSLFKVKVADKAGKISLKLIKSITMNSEVNSFCFHLSSRLVLLSTNTQSFLYFIKPNLSILKLPTIEDPRPLLLSLSVYSVFTIIKENQLKVFKIEPDAPHKLIHTLEVPNEAFTFSKVVTRQGLIIGVDEVANKTSIACYDLETPSPEKCLFHGTLSEDVDLSSTYGSLFSTSNSISTTLIDHEALCSLSKREGMYTTTLKLLQNRPDNLMSVLSLFAELMCDKSVSSSEEELPSVSLSSLASMFDSLSRCLVLSQTMSPPSVDQLLMLTPVPSIVGLSHIYDSLPSNTPVASFDSFEAQSIDSDTIPTLSSLFFDSSRETLLSLDSLLSQIPVSLRGRFGTIITQEDIVFSVLDPLAVILYKCQVDFVDKFVLYLIELVRSLRHYKLKPITNIIQYLLDGIVLTRNSALLYSLTESGVIVFDFALAEYLLKLLIQNDLTQPDGIFHCFVIEQLYVTSKTSPLLAEKVVNHLLSVGLVSESLGYLKSIGMKISTPRPFLIAALESGDLLLFFNTFRYLFNNISSKLFKAMDFSLNSSDFSTTALATSQRVLREVGCSDFVDFYNKFVVDIV
ncbi:hypothetical protein P9112_007568 [Eukaryota sp. TZLM1-RC]